MKTATEMLKAESWNIETIKSFAMICFENISHLHYCLKTFLSTYEY